MYINKNLSYPETLYDAICHIPNVAETGAADLIPPKDALITADNILARLDHNEEKIIRLQCEQYKWKPEIARMLHINDLEVSRLERSAIQKLLSKEYLYILRVGLTELCRQKKFSLEDRLQGRSLEDIPVWDLLEIPAVKVETVRALEYWGKETMQDVKDTPKQNLLEMRGMGTIKADNLLSILRQCYNITLEETKVPEVQKWCCAEEIHQFIKLLERSMSGEDLTPIMEPRLHTIYPFGVIMQIATELVEMGVQGTLPKEFRLSTDTEYFPLQEEGSHPLANTPASALLKHRRISPGIIDSLYNNNLLSIQDIANTSIIFLRTMHGGTEVRANAVAVAMEELYGVIVPRGSERAFRKKGYTLQNVATYAIDMLARRTLRWDMKVRYYVTEEENYKIRPYSIAEVLAISRILVESGIVQELVEGKEKATIEAKRKIAEGFTYLIHETLISLPEMRLPIGVWQGVCEVRGANISVLEKYGIATVNDMINTPIETLANLPIPPQWICNLCKVVRKILLAEQNMQGITDKTYPYTALLTNTPLREWCKKTDKPILDVKQVDALECANIKTVYDLCQLPLQKLKKICNIEDKGYANLCDILYNDYKIPMPEKG